MGSAGMVDRVLIEKQLPPILTKMGVGGNLSELEVAQGALVDDGIGHGEALKGIFLHLNTDKGKSAVLRRRKLTLCHRRDSQPVTRRECNCFTVKDGSALTSQNAVNFLVLLVGVNKGNASSRGKGIHADFCACQKKLFMQFGSALISDARLCIIFHGRYLRFVFASFVLLDCSLELDAVKNKYAPFYYCT